MCVFGMSNRIRHGGSLCFVHSSFSILWFVKEVSEFGVAHGLLLILEFLVTRWLLSCTVGLRMYPCCCLYLCINTGWCVWECSIWWFYFPTGRCPCSCGQRQWSMDGQDWEEQSDWSEYKCVLLYCMTPVSNNKSMCHKDTLGCSWRWIL